MSESSRFHVFTLRKLGERLATLPPGHRHTEVRSERGTPRFRAHALPSDPCMTGQGRQAGQAADSRKRHSQADPAKAVCTPWEEFIWKRGRTNPDFDRSPFGGRARAEPMLPTINCTALEVFF